MTAHDEGPAAAGSPWLAGWLVKTAGMSQAASNTDAWWRSCCDAGIAHLAAAGESFTAFDLIGLGVPEPHHANCWGPRLLSSARAGLIECVGVAQSRRPTSGLSLVRVWRGTSAVAS